MLDFDFDDNRAMYVLQSQLNNLPIMSLQTGKSVGTVKSPIIDRSKLELAGLFCRPLQGGPNVLLTRDIRQISRDAVIIDSFEDFSDPKDIVRLQPILEAAYQPLGLKVVDQQGRGLGKVEDYSINIKTNLMQKLYIHQSFIRSMLFNNVLVDRTQIIEAKPKQFIVSDTTTPQLVPGVKSLPKPASGR